MPPELYRWCELFVLNHFVPEKKEKAPFDQLAQGDRECGLMSGREKDGVNIQSHDGLFPAGPV